MKSLAVLKPSTPLAPGLLLGIGMIEANSVRTAFHAGAYRSRGPFPLGRAILALLGLILIGLYLWG